MAMQALTIKTMWSASDVINRWLVITSLPVIRHLCFMCVCGVFLAAKLSKPAAIVACISQCGLAVDNLF